MEGWKGGGSLSVAAPVALLAVLCWLVYGDAVHLGFTYDDEDYLRNARLAQVDPGLVIHPSIAAPWASRVGVHAYMYAVYPLFGDDPAPYHAVNVVLHAFNALLLWRLVAMRRRHSLPGFLAGLTYLLGTAHYRAVLWISAVSLVMGMSFLLGALLCVEVWLRRRGWGWLAAGSALFTGAVLSHQAFAAAAPLMILQLWDADPDAHLRKVPVAAVLFGVPALLGVGLEHGLYGGAYTGQPDYRLWGWHVPVNAAVYVWGCFLGPWVRVTGWHAPVALVWTVGGAGVILLSFLLGRRGERLWAAWILLGILPFALWNRPLVFSRYYYLPAAGAAALLGVAVSAAARRLHGSAAEFLRGALPVAYGAAVIGVGLHDLPRLESVQLYDEGKYLLFVRHDPARAIPRLEAALRRDPAAPPRVTVWLAWALYEQGDADRARRVLNRLLTRAPAYARARRLLQLLDAGEPGAPQIKF